MKDRRRPYRSISLPKTLLDEVGKVLEELGYWPTKTAFVRQAVLDMLEKYKQELELRRQEG